MASSCSAGGCVSWRASWSPSQVRARASALGWGHGIEQSCVLQSPGDGSSSLGLLKATPHVLTAAPSVRKISGTILPPAHRHRGAVVAGHPGAGALRCGLQAPGRLSVPAPARRERLRLHLELVAALDHPAAAGLEQLCARR